MSTNLLFLLLASSAAALDSYEAEYEAWLEFKNTFGKVYDTVEEELMRRLTFVENYQHIEKHNAEYHAGMHTYQLKINQFSDMTEDEFVSKMSCYQRNQARETTGATFLAPHNFKAPEEIDWRKRGYVTPIKNQGHCGSCYAFSTTGSLEGQMFRKTGKLVSLSEQQIVDCSTENGQCMGGLMTTAFEYIEKNGGIDSEASYPYVAKAGKCQYQANNSVAQVTGYVDVPKDNETQLKLAVATVGPVSVSVYAHHWFKDYHKGVFNDSSCGSAPKLLNHGVLVVGYGTDKATGLDYWIIKNSWGTSWGENGYMRLARNMKNECGVLDGPIYPTV